MPNPKWTEYFNLYGEDLLKAMPASELEMWYGAPFVYWYTHNYSFGKVGK